MKPERDMLIFTAALLYAGQIASATKTPSNRAAVLDALDIIAEVDRQLAAMQPAAPPRGEP